ncbi:hypothetical protein MTR_3g020990 [Medicago truncatula]|uniref:Protein IQ-DOMAIN 1-like n=1 Tax=Medicago truncatula TaxID=3880 RepID=G7IW99_MEDTR|nr:hypothetical protein MTR_3g020990 [Medicago truncatula]
MVLAHFKGVGSNYVGIYARCIRISLCTITTPVSNFLETMLFYGWMILPLETDASSSIPSLLQSASKMILEKVKKRRVTNFEVDWRDQSLLQSRSSWTELCEHFLARRTLRGLKALARLKALVKGQSVQRQAATTLQCMQTLSRLQSQVSARKIRMSEENQSFQRQLQQKRENELDKLQAAKNGKEKIQAKLLTRQIAAMRRENALAYASTHQEWTWTMQKTKWLEADKRVAPYIKVTERFRFC